MSRIQKNSNLLKHIKAFSSKYVSLLPVNASYGQRVLWQCLNQTFKSSWTPPDVEAGRGQAKPWRQNEVRYKIRFLDAHSYKKETKILIYLSAVTTLNTDWGGGKRTAHQRLSVGDGKAKHYNSLKTCSLGGSAKSMIIWYLPDNKYSCLLVLQRGSSRVASITRGKNTLPTWFAVFDLQ